METKRDSFLPPGSFDEFYNRLSFDSRAPIEVGGAVVGVSFVVNGEICRVYRGDPRRWGTIQKRLAFGDFNPFEKMLGEGQLGKQAAAELSMELMAPIDAMDRGPSSPSHPVPTDVTPTASFLNSHHAARADFERAAFPKKRKPRAKVAKPKRRRKVPSK